MPPLVDPALLPTQVRERFVLEGQQGAWHFETHRPVAFEAQRNTESSPDFGALFGQDIEPAGRYVITRAVDGALPRGWVALSVTLKRPLVIKLVPDADTPIYGPLGWKARLVRHYHKSGKALSAALRKDGYDAVVTVGVDRQGQSIDTREIVLLGG